MGTRAAYGFVINGQNKITYCHFDGYPTGLGNDLMNEFCQVDTDRLKEAVDNIILVNEETEMGIVSNKDYEAMAPYMNENVSCENDFWYRALRETQGTILPYLNENPVRFMIDNEKFMDDGLFCEYAYIINFDSEAFDIYYNGRNHVVSIPFQNIKNGHEADLIEELCEKLESYIQYCEYGDDDNPYRIKSKDQCLSFLLL